MPLKFSKSSASQLFVVTEHANRKIITFTCHPEGRKHGGSELQGTK